MIALIVAVPLLIIISLSVFGGGQVFMPIFQWLWNLMANQFGASNITDDYINTIFAVSNTTPGVVSTKFAFFTGYIVANGAWWGYLAMFLTYVVFCIPAIIIMVLAMKYINKFKTNTYVANMLLVMKPIVAGIMISLALQLLISVLLPQYYFNKGIDKYLGKYIANKPTGAIFFDVLTQAGHFRDVLLKIYVPIGLVGSFWLAKRKWSLFMIILLNIFISIILFVFVPYLAGYGWPHQL
ncbi:chromate transporter [Mycoplasma corogypsi]|uniref:chromate transporter n=1 Tax=Mycoplasma corogypsi TaxID=2106 RepID=UPI003872CAFD